MSINTVLSRGVCGLVGSLHPKTTINTPMNRRVNDGVDDALFTRLFTPRSQGRRYTCMRSAGASFSSRRYPDSPGSLRLARGDAHSRWRRVGSDRHFCRKCVKMTIWAPRATSGCVAAPEPILTIPGCPDISVSSATRLWSVRRCSDCPENVV